MFKLTFREAGYTVNLLSRHILTSFASTQRQNIIVAIIMHKGWEQVISALAVLSCHATYIPIDAKWPVKRAAQILEASGAAAVVTTQALVKRNDNELSRAIPEGVPVVLFEAATATMAEVAAGTANLATQRITLQDIRHAPHVARSTAYEIYTSGSTGKPKGVCCHHQGAMNTNMDLIERFDIGPMDRVLALSSLSFDLSVFDVFATMAAGATLVVPSARRAGDPASPAGPTGPDPEEWLRLVEDHGVTIWNAVPAFMELLVNHVEQIGRHLPACLRLVMMSGDWIPPTLPERIHRLSGRQGEGIRVISLGGATEAAIWSNMFEIRRGWRPSEHGWSCIPYGRPLRNQTMYVLDDATMEHCERWVTGVIYIGGAGVALGYYQNPEKTAKQFVLHPRTGEYLFRTGDLGRLRSSGEIEILGREDSQVKVNGYRIELGEIEKIAAKGTHIVESCAVVSSVTASPKIVLYVTVRSEQKQYDAADIDVGAVDEWSEIYDAVYTAQDESPGEMSAGNEVSVKAVSFDTSGWTNSYTGDALPREHMDEWLTETMRSINNLKPSSVLEIGFGTGMILHSLVTGKHASSDDSMILSYEGTDISQAAVARVQTGTLLRGVTPAQAAKVTVRKAGAHEDLVKVFHDSNVASAPPRHDLVIINSVIQYFPDAAYLRHVLESTVIRESSHLAGSNATCRIFVGDVRSFSLLYCFHLSIFGAQAAASLGNKKVSVEDISSAASLAFGFSFFALFLRLRECVHGVVELCLFLSRLALPLVAPLLLLFPFTLLLLPCSFFCDALSAAATPFLGPTRPFCASALALALAMRSALSLAMRSALASALALALARRSALSLTAAAAARSAAAALAAAAAAIASFAARSLAIAARFSSSLAASLCTMPSASGTTASLLMGS